MSEINGQEKPNLLERAISFLSPKWGAERGAYRTALNLQAAYQGAIPSRVSTRYGQTEAISGLSHLNLTVARNMRARALSLTENNQLAASIIDRAVENVIGNGFQVQAKTSNADWNAKADELFDNWKHDADFYGDTWVEHQKKVAYGLYRDGDHGCALLSKGQLQPVDADYISSPYSQANAFMHDGLELDKFGRTKNYYVMTWIDFRQKEWKPVPADKFIFVAHKRRITQYRGESYFAQSFDLFDQLKSYLDAVVQCQRIAACLAVFIRTTDPKGMVQGLSSSKNSKGVSQRTFSPLEPGMIQMLGPGEDISQITPQQPGSDFSSNIKMLIRLSGLSFGMPLENVLLDYSEVSGATAKASALQAQRSFETTQRLLIDDYFRPVWRWKIDQWIDDGELKDIEDKYAHQWHAEPWPYLDPVKEIQAAQLEIDAGLTTMRSSLVARGKDPDKMLAERATELNTMRANNIPIYHTAYVQPLVKETETAQVQGGLAKDDGTLPGNGENNV